MGVTGLIILLFGIMLILKIGGNNRSSIRREQTNYKYTGGLFQGIYNVHPVPDNPGKLLLFNKRNVIEYELPTNSTRKLLPEQNLPSTITRVSWSPNGRYLSFDAKGYFANDALGSILIKSNLDLRKTYTWIIDIKQGTYHLINKPVYLISWSKDSTRIVYTTNTKLDYSTLQVTGEEEGEEEGEEFGDLPTYIYELNPETKEENFLFETNKDVLNFLYISKDNYLYLERGKTEDSVYIVKKETGSKKTITTMPFNIFGTSPGAEHFYIFQQDDKQEKAIRNAEKTLRGRILIYDTKTFEIKETINGINSDSVLSWAPNAQTLYLYNNDRGLMLAEVGKKILAYENNGKPVITSGMLTHIIPTNSKEIIYTIDKEGVGAFSENINKPYNGKLTDHIKEIVSPNFFIKYKQVSNSFHIQITNPPIEDAKRDVFNYIKQTGINPDLVAVQFDTTIAEEKTQ